jgi:hypothetical protein
MNNLIKSRVHPLDAEAGAIFPPFRKKNVHTLDTKIFNMSTQVSQVTKFTKSLSSSSQGHQQMHVVDESSINTCKSSIDHWMLIWYLDGCYMQPPRNIRVFLAVPCPECIS